MLGEYTQQNSDITAAVLEVTYSFNPKPKAPNREAVVVQP